ncbi:MAG: cytochrome c maturation protein CcmE [Xanthomonadales bacterium]|nr:cytochrome c maturation protein CcmE [Xanthomonadales bacterium]ODU93947.1 MAG: cytochrome c biogenesis protein CcmE [Rhodanobacter sp. SCN 66-43]OJY82654.1 MAG: cytochrome c biogenesis protein CcmE [Xanthomonadales bacterium 66-474]
MNPVRKRRLIITLLILGAVAIATGLSVFALQRNMTYLYSPTEVDAGKAPDGHAFRLGGIVKEGSIHRTPGSLTTDFVITDRFQSIPVQYTGILPDLFRVGQSTITTGKMENGTFVATTVLAKHDETYMPPQVEQAIAKAREEHRIPPGDSPPPPAGEGQGGGKSANSPRPPSGHLPPQAGQGKTSDAAVQQ